MKNRNINRIVFNKKKQKISQMRTSPKVNTLQAIFLGTNIQ